MPIRPSGVVHRRSGRPGGRRSAAPRCAAARRAAAPPRRGPGSRCRSPAPGRPPRRTRRPPPSPARSGRSRRPAGSRRRRSRRGRRPRRRRRGRAPRARPAAPRRRQRAGVQRVPLVAGAGELEDSPDHRRAWISKSSISGLASSFSQSSREPLRVLGLELDHAPDPHVLDPLEAERRQRPLDRLALRVEDPLLRPDQDPRLRH